MSGSPDEDREDAIDDGEEVVFTPRPPWTVSVDLDRALLYVGIAMVAVATWQTLALLIGGVLEAWAYPLRVGPVFPTGYYSLALLGGVLLLLWAQSAATEVGRRRLDACCRVTVATATLQLVAQVVAAFDHVFEANIGLTSVGTSPPLPSGAAGRAIPIFGGLESLGDAVPAAAAIILALVLLARLRAAAPGAEEGTAGKIVLDRSATVPVLIGIAAYVGLAVLMQAGGRSHHHSIGVSLANRSSVTVLAPGASRSEKVGVPRMALES